MLACPTCGGTDSLLSVETILRAYPVTVADDRSMITRSDATPETWDDSPKWTGMIHCQACATTSPLGSLVTPERKDLASKT